MKKTENNYRNLVESLMCLFTADGDVKILLTRKKNEPYKGYWCLPNETISIHETIEDSVKNMMSEQYNYANFRMQESGIFSALDRDPENRVIGVSYIGIIDSVRAFIIHEETNDIDEFEWFPIENLPKLAYDHADIIKKALVTFQKELINTEVLKDLFPSDFTLPEIQKVYEQVYGIKYDRRNFRKKFLDFNLVKETGEKSEGHNGRPAMLYRFKDKTEDRILL